MKNAALTFVVKAPDEKQLEILDRIWTENRNMPQIKNNEFANTVAAKKEDEKYRKSMIGMYELLKQSVDTRNQIAQLNGQNSQAFQGNFRQPSGPRTGYNRQNVQPNFYGPQSSFVYDLFSRTINHGMVNSDSLIDQDGHFRIDRICASNTGNLASKRLNVKGIVLGKVH